MVFILGRFRQLELRFQFFTIGTNTFLHIWNLQWGFTALLHTQIGLYFRNNLVAILCCLPILGKSGMLNLNFVLVFDTLYGCCQVFIIKTLIKLYLSVSLLLASPCYIMMQREKTLLHNLQCLFVINNVLFNPELIILLDLLIQVKI